MANETFLIGDIGGTNARFALAGKSGFSGEQTLECADFATADDAIRQYLGNVGARSPTAICLAAAGPIVDGSVRFTNNPWTIAEADLSRVFEIDKVRLLNDFEAIAYSVPLLTADDVQTIGLPDPGKLDKAHYTVGIIGPGTGLGAVGLRRFGEHFIPIPGEYGHGGFAPETQVQLDVLRALRERFDRVSSERLVSGQGIENLYWALTQIHGEKRAKLTAPEIFAASIKDGDARATEAVEMFFEIFGQVAGDLALTLGASDGIFIAGGIAKRYPEKLASSRFRSGFESKGRHRSLMERIPTQLITHEQPGLLGASWYVRQMSS